MSGQNRKAPCQTHSWQKYGEQEDKDHDPERRKALRKTQKKCIAAQVVMCAAYISAGILLAVTGRHCVADTPIYIAGAVITAGCMAALAVFESRLSRELAG